MDDSWLLELAGACAGSDEVAVLDAVRRLLGDGALVTTWRPGREGWDQVHGDDVPTPTVIPPDATVVSVGFAHVVRVGTDPTASRMLCLEAPTLSLDRGRAATQLVGVALSAVVAEEAAAYVRLRLDDNERIGRLGSYDWHVPTDTNRWSDELFRIYGEQPQSFNASYERFMEFIHPDDREKVTGIHQAAFGTMQPYEMEERIVLADGTERLLWSNGEVIAGPDGQPERFIGICRDVTDERAAQVEAARAQLLGQQAQEAEIRRLAALELNDSVVQGLTAAAWAHDIDAPEVARSIVNSTLEAARGMMDDLLVRGDQQIPEAGDLRRMAAPAGRIDAGTLPPMTSAGSAPRDDERRRVVIADDAPDVRLLLRVQLGAMGLEVVGEAANGQEAVDLVAAHAPDLVLLDLSMPVMDGLEATTLIRAAQPDVRIVVVSGWATESMAERALTAGADEYLEKGTDLIARLRSVLGEVAA